MPKKIIPQDQLKALKETADKHLAAKGCDLAMSEFVFTLMDACFVIGELSQLDKAIKKTEELLRA